MEIDNYQSPLSSRYASEAMRFDFSDTGACELCAGPAQNAVAP
jgi:hypothetical protein